MCGSWCIPCVLIHLNEGSPGKLRDSHNCLTKSSLQVLECACRKWILPTAPWIQNLQALNTLSLSYIYNNPNSIYVYRWPKIKHYATIDQGLPNCASWCKLSFHIHCINLQATLARPARPHSLWMIRSHPKTRSPSVYLQWRGQRAQWQCRKCISMDFHESPLNSQEFGALTHVIEVWYYLDI